jgi:hypothetical protein
VPCVFGFCSVSIVAQLDRFVTGIARVVGCLGLSDGVLGINRLTFMVVYRFEDFLRCDQ